MSETPTQAECGWIAYEQKIYAEVAYTHKRNRIAAVIGAYVRTDSLPTGWPGSQLIANAIMKELGL